MKTPTPTPISLRLLFSVFLCIVPGMGLGSPGAVEKIVGTWRGTSTCVDRAAAPSCNDEQVVYDIAPAADSPGKVTVRADRIVDGKRVFMGEIEYTPAEDGSWTGEFQSPRLHSQWRLVVSGDSMTGTGILLPSKAVVRRLALERQK